MINSESLLRPLLNQTGPANFYFKSQNHNHTARSGRREAPSLLHLGCKRLLPSVHKKKIFCPPPFSACATFALLSSPQSKLTCHFLPLRSAPNLDVSLCGLLSDAFSSCACVCRAFSPVLRLFLQLVIAGKSLRPADRISFSFLDLKVHCSEFLATLRLLTLGRNHQLTNPTVRIHHPSTRLLFFFSWLSPNVFADSWCPLLDRRRPLAAYWALPFVEGGFSLFTSQGQNTFSSRMSKLVCGSFAHAAYHPDLTTQSLTQVIIVFQVKDGHVDFGWGRWMAPFHN